MSMCVRVRACVCVQVCLKWYVPVSNNLFTCTCICVDICMSVSVYKCMTKMVSH